MGSDVKSRGRGEIRRLSLKSTDTSREVWLRIWEKCQQMQVEGKVEGRSEM